MVDFLHEARSFGDADQFIPLIVPANRLDLGRGRSLGGFLFAVFAGANKLPSGGEMAAILFRRKRVMPKAHLCGVSNLHLKTAHLPFGYLLAVRTCTPELPLVNLNRNRSSKSCSSPPRQINQFFLDFPPTD